MSKPNNKHQSGDKDASKKRKQKDLSGIQIAYFNVFATKNNTIFTMTDPSGKVILPQASSGQNFRGTKKSTPYAAKETAFKLLSSAHSLGINNINLNLRGIAPGRDAAVEALKTFCATNPNFVVNAVCDKTPFPHNGCRPKKRRRV